MPADNLLRFTLRQLQYFQAVARVGQISLAATECHVTQSAITSAIADLERTLGTLLFERGRTGVKLTYHGHLFLQSANAVLDAAGDASRHPFREPSSIEGSIEVAASYTVLGYFLLPYIAKFQEQHPRVTVVPVESERADIEQRVIEGTIELAVVLTSNLRRPTLFHRNTLARSRRQLWLADDHPLAERSQVSMEEIAQFPYVVPTVDEGDVNAMAYWAQASIEPCAILKTSSMEAVREMVALGLGVTILSDMLFRPWSLDGKRIRAVPLSHHIPPMEVGVIRLKTKRLSSVGDALVKYLEVAVRSGSAD